MKTLPFVAAGLLAFLLLAGVALKKSHDHDHQLLVQKQTAVWKQLNNNLSDFSADVKASQADRSGLNGIRLKAERLADKTNDLRLEVERDPDPASAMLTELAKKENKYASTVSEAARQQASMAVLRASGATLIDMIGEAHDKHGFAGSPDRSDVQAIEDKVGYLLRLANKSKPQDQIKPVNDTEAKPPSVIIVHDSDRSKSEETSPWNNLPAGYLKPDSDSRYLTESDLTGRTDWELDIMRNEIYARHGRPFQRGKYQAYFSRQPWYTVRSDYNESWLSGIEKRNASFIASYQRAYSRTTH